MKASLKQYQQSPRKVRLIADFVRGKNVNKVLTELQYVPKKASLAIAKLVKSAAANATENEGKDGSNLFIKEIRVDEGKTFYRMRPRARGRGMRYTKRTSNVAVVLGEEQSSVVSKTEGKSKKATTKKATKKTTTKKADTKPVAKKETKKPKNLES